MKPSLKISGNGNGFQFLSLCDPMRHSDQLSREEEK